MRLTNEEIAQFSNAINRTYSQILGREDLAGQWVTQLQRQNIIECVDAVRRGLITASGEAHERWLWKHIEDGWVYGPVKDAVLKQHPCLLPFGQLPEEEQFRDWLFLTTVKGLLQAR